MHEELIAWLRSWSEIPAHCECYESCDECDKQDLCDTFTNESIITKAGEAAEVIEKFQDYMKAEVEGRMIILPVKEGTPLYVDGKIFAAHCKGEIHEVKDWYYSFPMIYKDFRGEHDYVIDPDSIGNSVFLTREEAEKNLAKEEK